MPTAIITFPGPGCIVEFLEANRVIQAYVLESSGPQLRLYTLGKRETKMPASRLLPWAGPAYGPSASRQEMDERLALHHDKRKALTGEIDVLQLWELAQGEMEKADVSWFAELLWPEADIDRLAALGHALLNAKTHFKFNPPHFEIYPAELVEQRLQKAEAERRTEEVVSAGSLFLRKLWDISNNRRGPLTNADLPPEETASLIRRMILARLADPESTESDSLWKMLIKSLPEETHLPLLLAIAWGLKPPHYNFWLDRADYSPAEDWDAPFKAEQDALAAAVASAAPAQNEAPLVEGGFISIDPSTTLDWDDAFKLEALGPDAAGRGRLRLSLALACPAAFWPFGSALDEAVAYRSTSLYLPEGSLHMMPRRLSLELFSLKSGPALPALLVEIEVGEDGELFSVAPRQAWVKIAANLGYEMVEEVLDGSEGPAGPDTSVPGNPAPASPANPARPWQGMLRAASALASALQKRRVERGAVITEKPDPAVRLEGGGNEPLVRMEPEKACPLAQNLVGELMILCNSGLAQWGLERGLPLLYRTQDVALPKEFAGVWTSAPDIFRVIKALPPAGLELAPRPHAGLGAAVYATFTSPMRRYVDLLNEAQVIEFLRSGQPRFSPEALQGQLPALAERISLTGQVQRFRPRYWKLLYLLQQNQGARDGGKPWWEATVLEENDNFVNVNLDAVQITLRTPRNRFAEKVYQGQSIVVRLAKINPLHNEVQIVEAMEN